MTEKQKKMILFVLTNCVKNQAEFKNEQIKKIYEVVSDSYKDLLKDIKEFLKKLSQDQQIKAEQKLRKSKKQN